MPVGAIAAIGSVAGGLSQASAARRAGRAQENAANQQLALEREVYEDTSANFAPFREGGGLGFQAYLAEMGLADMPTIGGTAPQIETFTSGGTPGTMPVQTGAAFNTSGGMDQSPQATAATPGVTQFRVGTNTFSTMEDAQAFANANRTGGRQFGGFQATPGFQFQLDRGMDALNTSNAARGNLLSGANIAGAMQFGQGLANQEYGNYMNRLQGIGQQGQAAAGNQAAAGQAFATGAGNALAGIGNAQAAGAIGAGNAISGGINNVMGTLGYLNTQNRGGTTGGSFWGQNIFGARQ